MATIQDLKNYKKSNKDNQYDKIIESAAKYYDIDKNILEAQVYQESKGDTTITGYKLEDQARPDGKRYFQVDDQGNKIPTAFGLMQLKKGTFNNIYPSLPANVKERGANIHDPVVNVYAGAKYLKDNYDLVVAKGPDWYDENEKWSAALVGYNAGIPTLNNSLETINSGLASGDIIEGDNAAHPTTRSLTTWRSSEPGEYANNVITFSKHMSDKNANLKKGGKVANGIDQSGNIAQRLENVDAGVTEVPRSFFKDGTPQASRSDAHNTQMQTYVNNAMGTKLKEITEKFGALENQTLFQFAKESRTDDTIIDTIGRQIDNGIDSATTGLFTALANWESGAPGGAAGVEVARKTAENMNKRADALRINRSILDDPDSTPEERTAASKTIGSYYEDYQALNRMQGTAMGMMNTLQAKILEIQSLPTIQGFLKTLTGVRDGVIGTSGARRSEAQVSNARAFLKNRAELKGIEMTKPGFTETGWNKKLQDMAGIVGYTGPVK